MRRAARIDRNQPDVVLTLRRLGYVVHETHAAGDGFPDLVVGTPQGRIVLVEVKDGGKPPSARRLTDEQEVFHRRWLRFPVLVVTSPEDAVTQLGLVAHQSS